MAILRSGDVLRIAPGRNNPDDLLSVHMIHPALFNVRLFGFVKTTFLAYEEVALGGDRRLSKIALGTVSWEFPRTCKLGINAILDYADLVDLDAPVTIRTWTGEEFADASATLQYLPGADVRDNPEYNRTTLFEFIDVEVIT